MMTTTASGKLAKARRRDKLREKLDFKFQFHATRVPNSGWDKLYVSLESTETGKATAKTAKSPVQAGVCRWPDAVTESARLLHDTRNNSYEAKLYKFVVGTSSTRILGEVVLNLADYVSATSSPASLSLPLKSCSAGTLLHVKVQCLTSWPTESPRDGGEQARDAQPDGHLSDDDDDGADDSTSPIGPQTPASTKDKVLIRYNSDSSDFSTPGSTTPNSGTGGAPSPATPVNSFNARLERSSGRRSVQEPSATKAARGQNGNVAADDLRAEFASLQANSRKLEKELECLRGMLEERSSQLSEREVDISTLVTERDGLLSELEQLSRVTEEKQGGIVLQLQECRHLIGELQQVLEEEKLTRMKLEVQLKQAEETNVQLVRTIDQLETALVDRKREAEELVCHNRKLETSLSEQEHMMLDLEKVLSDKLHMRDEEIKDIKAKCDKLEQEALCKRQEAASEEQVDGMKNNIEELEADIKELTDENMDLIFKLNMANKELLKYSNESDYVGMDALDERVRLLRRQQDANNERLLLLEATNKQLVSSNKQLEARLCNSVEEMQSLRAELQASKNMHETNMETFSAREQKLKARSDEIHEKYAMTFGLVSELEAELDALKKENHQLKSSSENLQSELGGLEVLKSDLVYRLANMEMDNSRLRSQAQKYESELAERLQELAAMGSRVSMLEASLVDREASAQSRGLIDSERLLELERQVSLAITSNHELESRIEALAAEKAALENLLQFQQANSSILDEKLESAVGELEEAKVLLQLEVSAREKVEKKTAELSSIKGELEKRAVRAEQEKWQLAEKISDLEMQLHDAANEVESYKQQCASSGSQLLELEKELAELEARTSVLDGLRTQVSQLESSLSEARQEKSGLEVKLKQLEQAANKQADEYVTLAVSANEDRELLRRAQLDKSAAVERLQSEVQRLTQQLMDGQKEQLASEALMESSRLRTEKMVLESELDSYKGKLEESSRRLANADEEYGRQLLCWESQKQKLAQENAELRSRELEMAQLKSESDACVEKLRLEKDGLEATVQRLDALNAQLQKDKASLEDKLSQFLAELHQLKAAKASLENKMQSLKAELASKEASEAEQRIESMRLRKQNSDLRQKSLEHKEEREELRLRIETMEAELKKRSEADRKHRIGDENGRTANGTGVLAKSLSKSNVNVKVYSRDTIELRDRIKVLEGEVKQKAAQAEALSKQIESSATKDEQQVEKLRDQVSVLARREQEMVNSQQLLRKEMDQLQQVNLQLQETLAACKAEPEPMYKEQLACALAAGDVDPILDNLLWYRRKGRELEAELSDVRERYLNMSLKFAEVEAEREQLVMTIRSLRNNNRSRTTLTSLLSL